MAAPSRPRWSNLPPQGLENILGQVPLLDRHRNATLVSRDWHNAANIGALHHQLDIAVRGVDFLPRLRRLQQWLLQHCSQHVTRLRLALRARALSPAELHEAHALLAGMLAACTGLQELHISSPFGFSVVDWRPQKAGTLAALTRLSLHGFVFTNKTLGRLPALPRLQLKHCTKVPSDMSALTSLKALAIDDSPFGLLGVADWARLEAALPSLTHLTGLWINASASYPPVVHPPATLTALTRLRLLSLETHDDEGAQGAALPDGPWLVGLQRLAAAQWVLYHSLPALAAATRLQQLSISMDARRGVGRGDGEEGAAGVVKWAARVPSLQRLAVGASPSAYDVKLSQEMIAAQHNSPDALFEFDMSASVGHIFH